MSIDYIKKVGVSDGMLNGSSLGINIVNSVLMATQFQDSALVLYSGFTFFFCACFELPVAYWADQNGVRKALKYSYFFSVLWSLTIVLATYAARNKIQFLYYPSITLYSITCSLTISFFKGTYQTAYLIWFNNKFPDLKCNLFVESFIFSLKWKLAIPTLMLVTTIILKFSTENYVYYTLLMIVIVMILRFYTTYRDLSLHDTEGDILPKESRITLRSLIESTVSSRPETGAYAYSVIARNFTHSVLFAKCSVFMGHASTVSIWISVLLSALIVNFLNMGISYFLFSYLKKLKKLSKVRWYGVLGLFFLACFGLSVFVLSNSRGFQLAVLLVFCLFSLSFSDVIKYEIESNVNDFVDNKYKASWFGAGNLLSYLFYAFFAFIIWVIGHHEYDVQLIFSSILIYGLFLIVFGGKHLSKTGKIEINGEKSLNHLILNKLLFLIVPTMLVFWGFVTFILIEIKKNTLGVDQLTLGDSLIIFVAVSVVIMLIILCQVSAVSYISRNITEKVRSILIEDRFSDPILCSKELMSIREIYKERMFLIRLDTQNETMGGVQKIVHDIKSPINRIRRSVSVEVDRTLINDQLGKLSELVGEILGHDANKPVSAGRINSINTNLKSVCKKYRSTYCKLFPDIDITFKTTFNRCFVQIASQDIERVISNLIDNAIEANATVIELSLSKADFSTVLTISDNGPGIPEYLKGKIFRETGISTKESGNGLGLSSVGDIVDKNGARIDFRSDNSGTSFTIIFPEVKTEIAEIDSVHIESDQNVILIDDDPEIHKYWKNELGGQLVSCYSEEDFLSQKMNLDDQSFLIMDENLGDGLSGLTLIRKYHLHSNSVLISDSVSSADIRNKCLKDNLRFFPKNHLDGLVIYKRNKSPDNISYLIFVDDDIFAKKDFEIYCKLNHIANSMVYDFPDLDLFSSLNRNSTIILDQYYEDSLIEGVVVGMDLYSMGFRNIILHSNLDIELPYWFSQKISKGDLESIKYA